MFVVIVTFDVTPERVEAAVAAVEGVVARLVAHQPGFRRARIHRGAGATPGKAVNYMEWDSEADFMAFRAAHAEEVTAAVGEFGPGFSFFTVAAETPAAVVT
jgi:heme-degrading monooxygenase HmoA